MKKSRQKKKPRDSDEETIERLNTEVRELKSLNRSLLRRIKKLDRNYEESLEILEDVFVPGTESNKSTLKCPKCKVGELQEVIIESLSKKYSKCTGFGCRYRTSTIKV